MKYLTIIQYHKDKLIKVFLIILFIFITISLIETYTTDLNGYEGSIYSKVPLVLEIVFSIIFLFYLYILITENHRYYAITILLLFLVFTISLALFLIRGYFFMGGDTDPSAHVSFVNGIVNSGFFGDSLIYPIIHIYSAIIVILLNITTISIANYLPWFFGGLSFIFFGLFVRTVVENKTTILLVLLLFSSFVCGWYLNFTANHLSFLVFPLFLYIILRTYNAKNKRLDFVILLLILIPFLFLLHPTCFFLAAILLLMPFIRFLFVKLQKNIQIEFSLGYLTIIPFIYLIIVGTFWYSSFSVWNHTISDVVGVLANEAEGFSKLNSISSNIDYAESFGFDPIDIILKTYGRSMVIILLTIISFPIIRTTRIYNKNKNLFLVLYYSICLIIFTIVFLYIFNPVINPLRFIGPLLFLCLPIVGVFVVSLGKILRDQSKFFYVVFCLGLVTSLFFSSIFGFITLYPSSFNYNMNSQTTNQEVTGLGWTLFNRDPDVKLIGITTQPIITSDLIQGPKNKKVEQIKSRYLSVEDNPPLHFNYQTNKFLGASFREETDMIITNKDMIKFSITFPKMAKYKWDANDFSRLSTDQSIYLIYSNGEYELLKISSIS